MNSRQVCMKGTLVGISVFCLFSFAVAVAAVGVITQTYNEGASPSITGLSVTEYDNLAARTPGESDSGLFQAFTYVCPFH